MTCPWKSKGPAVLLILISVSGTIYLSSYDFRYMVDTGISVLSRRDAGSIERFLYQYEDIRPLVYIFLMVVSMIIPNLWLPSLYEAGHSLFGQPAGVFYGFGGCTLGIFLFLITVKTLPVFIAQRQKYFRTIFGMGTISDFSIRITQGVFCISPVISTQLFWILALLAGMSHVKMSRILVCGALGLTVLNISTIIY